MSTPNDNKRKLEQLDAQIARTADPMATDALYKERDRLVTKLALAEEKANQEKIGATVQAARTSATQPEAQSASFLPWYHERGCDQYYNEWVVKDCDGRSLISLWRDSDEDNQANAAFIALACNSYAGLMQQRDALQVQRDELLAACQLDVCERLGSVEQGLRWAEVYRDGHAGQPDKGLLAIVDAIARATEGGTGQ